MARQGKGLWAVARPRKLIDKKKMQSRLSKADEKYRKKTTAYFTKQKKNVVKLKADKEKNIAERKRIEALKKTKITRHAPVKSGLSKSGTYKIKKVTKVNKGQKLSLPRRPGTTPSHVPLNQYLKNPKKYDSIYGDKVKKKKKAR